MRSDGQIFSICSEARVVAGGDDRKQMAGEVPFFAALAGELGEFGIPLRLAGRRKQDVHGCKNFYIALNMLVVFATVQATARC